MTLEQAREHVGHGVVYKRTDDRRRSWEQGVITSVNDTFVFVRYGSQITSAATYPEDLELMAPGGGGQQ